MYKPPRNSQGAESDRRSQGLESARRAAQELFDEGSVQSLWQAGNEKEILNICKQKAFVVGEPSYVTQGMIFTALKGLLRTL